MPHSKPQRLGRQLASHLQHVQASDGLPFAPLLDPEQVREAVRAEAVSFRERLFSPLVTLSVFLSQLFDPDHSCRQAVARFLAWRLASGQSACSADSSAYGKARGRLPEGVLRRLTRQTGQARHQQAPQAWQWHGRRVKVVDGTTVSMPDTPANQAAYPQPSCQKPGLGFPLARVVVIFSLAVGTVLEAALGRYQGKEQGETALLRTLLDTFEPDDLLLSDRYFCTYWNLAWASQHHVDMVARSQQLRPADFRRGRRLGKDDHVIVWTKPKKCPDWMAADTYAAMPATLTIRQVRVAVRQAGFRTDSIVVVTTLLDAQAFPKDELTNLYRARWQAELHLRSLKPILQMDILRGQTPEMVRKEIWGHLLAYNLIRTVMACAAEAQDLSPGEISFKGTLQTLNAFAPYLRVGSADQQSALFAELLTAVATHRVGNRPDRYEPRKRKRRPKPLPLLTETRAKAKAKMAKGHAA